MTDVDQTDYEISDDELAALAMAADPDSPLGDDAVPLSSYLLENPGLLPSWYMPPASGFSRSRRRRATVLLFIIALAGVNASGLCVTNGHLEIPF